MSGPNIILTDFQFCFGGGLTWGLSGKNIFSLILLKRMVKVFFIKRTWTIFGSQTSFVIVNLMPCTSVFFFIKKIKKGRGGH